MKITRKAGKINALKASAKALNGGQQAVGWFESAKYESGAPVAGVAYVQEFGSDKRSIPPRSFFRTTAAEKKVEWAETSKSLAKAAANGKIKPEAVLELTGEAAAGHVRATISKITEPPLSQLTLLARMHRKEGGAVTGKTIGQFAKRVAEGPQQISGVSTKPLVDTAIMLNTLTSQSLKK